MHGGLERFAQATGTCADEVLAVLSFLLAGTAGSEAWLGGIGDGTPLPDLDLLVRRRDEALRRMAGQLVARLRPFNRALAAAAEDGGEDLVRLTRRGAFAGGPAARFADPEDTRKARMRLLDKLAADAGAQQTLTQDLEGGAGAARIEALLHPQFLLESVRCRDLGQALDQCHQRSALVVSLKTDPARVGSEPVRDLRGLLDLMDGLATPGWQPDSARSRALPLRARVLLEADDADLSLMARVLPEMAGRFLWLSADGADASRPRDAGEGHGHLMECFTRASMDLLGLRRAGQTIAFAASGALPAKWPRAMDRYRRSVARMGACCQTDLGPAVRELPGVLAFGLGLLCIHGARDGGTAPATVEILAAALRTARRLARRHGRALSLFLRAEEVGRRLKLARQILAKLEVKGPKTHRQLVRCFSIQHKERFEPVIAALTGLGLLVWQEDGRLAVGETELAEVEDDLRQALLAPVAARADAGTT